MSLSETSATPASVSAELPAQIPEHAGEEASRSPIKPPELSAVVAAAEAAAATAPHMDTVVASIPVHHGSPIVTPEQFAAAETNLANYIASKINPELIKTQPLLLTMSNMLGSADELATTDIKLCFKGGMVEANFAEMQREIAHALQAHPLLAPQLMANKILVMDQVNGDAQGQMLHVHIPHLTPEHYAELIRDLAAAPHTAKAHPHHGHKKPHAHDDAAANVAEEVATDAVVAHPPTLPTMPPLPTPAPQPVAGTATEPKSAEAPAVDAVKGGYAAVTPSQPGIDITLPGQLQGVLAQTPQQHAVGV